MNLSGFMRSIVLTFPLVNACDNLLFDVIIKGLSSPCTAGMSHYMQLPVQSTDQSCMDKYYNEGIEEMREETIVSIQNEVIHHTNPASAARGIYKYLLMKVISPEWRNPELIYFECGGSLGSDVHSFRPLLAWLKQVGECYYN